MKYFYEHYNDDNEMVNEEVSKTRAEELLSSGYNNIQDIINMPCYYRLMFGGVEIIEEVG